MRRLVWPFFDTDVVLRKEVAELFGYDLEYRYVLPTSAFVSESVDTTDQILSELIDVAAFKCIVNEVEAKQFRSNAKCHRDFTIAQGGDGSCGRN